MDRRQKKSRAAILSAFVTLLKRRDLQHISVSDVIALADVGRATFYAHFPTKDFLLKELCNELFAHVFSATDHADPSPNLFSCEVTGSVLTHLLQHLQRNDNGILDLLTSCNNELFLGYFEQSLALLFSRLLAQFPKKALPESLYVAQLSASFTATVRWWIEHGLRLAPSDVEQYFLLAVL